MEGTASAYIRQSHGRLRQLLGVTCYELPAMDMGDIAV